ncbi:MAG: aminotransferase class I/II-fold pyridoxal phosphate-dependent enzyme [Actinomycetota bacterium]|nr:aminotransferase class I/II-fold pyridoxal phosphate-dependent enzyme [Actinomycetota bacterium]
MHTWDETTDLLAYSVFGYVVERVKRDKDPHWGAKPADELARSLAGAITREGIGGHQALALFRDELLPACRPMEHPLNLAYVATAPSHAAVLFDLVVSASSIFGGLWECGAGAIAAENQTLHWLAELAGFPDEAAGCFVSGGSAANLSALVAARHVARKQVDEPPARWCFATTRETHASVHAAARTMDVDVVSVEPDERGAMTGDALAAAIDEHRRRNPHDRLFAVVANAGTTNVGAIDELEAIADLCDAHDLWMHIDGAYGGATLCAPSMKEALRGFERADSFGIDPHKWMFAPYDCAALVYRDPIAAAQAHAQHGDYLDAVDRSESNPSDLAFHLSRRARGLPLWFSLATHGTDAYATAVEHTLDAARGFADHLRDRDGFTLLLDPQMSVVLFEVDGWDRARYDAWTTSRAHDGVGLVVPTTWRSRTCYRVCLVNPLTTVDMLVGLADDMAAYGAG